MMYCWYSKGKIKPFLMDEADYSTTIEFPKFKIHFTFDIGSSTGYRFMEGTLEELTSGFVDHNNLLARFEFSFSKLLFSPYDIHNVIRSNEFCTLDFHRISTPVEVSDCLQIILGFIDKNLIAINSIADNQQLQKEIVDNYFADVVALIVSMFGFGISEKNTMVTTDAYGVYYNGQKVGTECTLEFVHLQGYETFEQGNTVFEAYDDYIVILNGDYENYVYCDGLLNDDGSVNTDVLNYIKGSGCSIKTYRTLDDYCKAHNITTDE